MVRVLKLAVLLLLAFEVPVWAQAVYCNVGPQSLTTTGRITFNNTANQCSNFTFTYYSRGFSAVSIEVDGAPDTGGAAGSWTAITAAGACTLSGSNPQTSTAAGTVVLTGCYYPWISINLASKTGTGSVTARLYGAGTATAGGKSGGSPGGVASGDLAGTYPAPTVAHLSHVTDASLDNTGLVNSSLTVNGTAIALGASGTVTAAPSGTATGDLSGSYPAPAVAAINGAAVPLSASCVGTNSSRQIVSVACGGPPSGTASGDLSGTYPSPAVAKVNGGSLPIGSAYVGTDGSGKIVTASTPAAAGPAFNTGTTDPGVPPYSSIRQTNTGDSGTLNFTSNVVAGNILIAIVRCAASGPATITGNTQGITFTTAAYSSGNYFIGTALSSGPESISVTGCAFDTYFGLIEIQATAGIDGSVVTSSTGPPSLTTATAYDTIYYMGVIPGATTSTGASVVVVNNTNNLSIAYQNTTSTGTYTSALSAGGSTAWIAVAYKAVPVANPGANGDMYLNLTTHHLWGPKAAGNWTDAGLVTPSPTVSGDLTGTLPSLTVAKVNGGSLPISSTYVGTDGSGKIVTASTPAASGWQLISRQTLGSAAANITFSSIPGTYHDLVITINARSSSTSTDLGMQINGDTGTNYMRSYAGGAAGAIQGNSTGQTIAAIGPLDFNTDTAGAFASYFITLGNYTSTTFWKAGTSAAGNFSGSTNPMVLTTWFAWRSTAAVTSIVFAPADGSNLVTGTTAALYGVL